MHEFMNECREEENERRTLQKKRGNCNGIRKPKAKATENFPFNGPNQRNIGERIK